jgi:protein SCO1/2
MRQPYERRWGFTGVACGALLLATAASACRPPAGRQYELQGQILAVDAARQELTIKHQDIPGFMPAMTMAFKVGAPRLMEGRTAGELVTATLVVNDSEAHLRAIARTGFAPFESTDAPTRVMDLIQPGDPARDATLVDETGRQRRLADWRGHVVAVTFVYTRCPLPDFCPLMDRHFKTAQSRLKDDHDLRDAVRLLSVSVDPEYDTPPVLAARATELGADPAVWQFLTGERDQVESFAAQFGVSVVRKSPSPADIVHNIRTAILDGNGRLVATLSGTAWAPEDLMTEIRRAHAKR